MGKTGKLFEDLKEPKARPQQQDARVEIAQDFERIKAESIAYFALMKRVSDLRDEAHFHVMALSDEPVGRKWKERLNAFDEVLGIPEIYARKAIAAGEEVNIRSLV